MTGALHFVGFRGREYLSAVRVFGLPDFIHIRWDRIARAEIMPGDVAVFAKGSAGDPVADYNGPDIIDDGVLSRA